jgi:hypothetical protein
MFGIKYQNIFWCKTDLKSSIPYIWIIALNILNKLSMSMVCDGKWGPICINKHKFTSFFFGFKEVLKGKDGYAKVKNNC